MNYNTEVSNNEVISHFSFLKNYDWFHDVESDSSGRIVIYVNKMSKEIEKFIPITMLGKQVLVHFAVSKLASKEKFCDIRYKSEFIDPEFVEEILDDADEINDCDIEFLNKEINRLEEICGVNILQDVFFESHDGKNAVTNLSNKYPEVRKSVDKLYKDYGFDVLYEALEIK